VPVILAAAPAIVDAYGMKPKLGLRSKHGDGLSRIW
jgi:hypothetical protein